MELRLEDSRTPRRQVSLPKGSSQAAIPRHLGGWKLQERFESFGPQVGLIQ